MSDLALAIVKKVHFLVVTFASGFGLAPFTWQGSSFALLPRRLHFLIFFPLNYVCFS